MQTLFNIHNTDREWFKSITDYTHSIQQFLGPTAVNTKQNNKNVNEILNQRNAKFSAQNLEQQLIAKFSAQNLEQQLIQNGRERS